MGKSSINGPFSMAMLNSQRVTMVQWLSKVKTGCVNLITMVFKCFKIMS